jgi:hypothetical protein
MKSQPFKEICVELAWALGCDKENFLPSQGLLPEDESVISRLARNRLRRWSRNLFSSLKGISSPRLVAGIRQRGPRGSPDLA